jgi:hypothetical protein
MQPFQGKVVKCKGISVPARRAPARLKSVRISPKSVRTSPNQFKAVLAIALIFW